MGVADSQLKHAQEAEEMAEKYRQKLIAEAEGKIQPEAHNSHSPNVIMAEPITSSYLCELCVLQTTSEGSASKKIYSSVFLMCFAKSA